MGINQIQELLLIADIGGTNCRLALYQLENNKTKLIRKVKLTGKDCSQDFVSTLKTFLKKDSPSYACLAVAGVIKNNKCHLTNRNWNLCADTLKSQFKFRELFLINDLIANGLGVSCLNNEHLVTVCKGKYNPQSTKAILSPGTGLGESIITVSNNEENHLATEGGHCDFAPVTPQEINLLKFLQNKYKKHISYEYVLSGMGICNIYQFLDHSNSSIKAPQISKAALDRSCKIAHETIKLFSILCGREAGNLALKSLPYSGLYIGGGIIPHLIPIFQEHFINGFLDKGRFKPLLETIPVHIIKKEDCTLIGAKKKLINFILKK